MRIASLQPSVTLILHELDRLDCLCAITKYCLEALPELAARGLPVLHDSWSADVQEIQAARPELVIASVPYRMESLAAILKAGLPVMALAPHTLKDIFQDIRLISSVVDARAEGNALIERMRASIQTARAQTAGAPRRTVYCEEWGKPLIHSQRWVAELVEAAGGEFVGDAGAQTDADVVAAVDPEVLVFSWCGAGDRVPLERVVERRQWQHLRAVQEGNVFCIPDEFLNTPAPPLLEGLACLGAAIHPEIFILHKRLIRLEKLAASR